ncbi:uncharacterized protein EAE97_001741 [Botrytis byssoidea]|uniref:C2H2-type domain-containing protein n=1 Tax=Botrytis byssoidea TaxID=139641 RepID=A0A9P5IUU5_9HELO|nr:uncharacterized protein EAE97_001741 [Botrytis byssoidea]KAF7952244.1 hypothetical protein EAE97_001741 [Botrytis byssoidea]
MASGTASFRAPGMFGCEFCPKALPTKGSLNRHRNTHIRPYKCDICQSGFALRSDLRRHEGKHGSVDPQYMCKWPKCDFRGSARKDNLLRHMKKMHSEVVPTDEEDTCNATLLRDAYDEAVENRKESEKSLTILRLVQDGNITSLELLLHEGGNVMETTDTGKTALHIAAFNGHLKIVELLLNMNIEHNAKDSDGRSALHEAARGGNSQIFRELIAAGLDLFDRNNNGEDPLCEACRNGHRDLVQEILGMETQPWSRNDSILSLSPLTLYSIYNHNIDDGKADRLRRGIKLAIENGHRAITEAILFQYLDSNRTFLEYALKKAASLGDYQLVVSILQRKDRLRLRVCFRALRLAAVHRDSPIMDTLFEEAIRPKIGADMKELHILLLRVAACDNDDIVRFLIEKGANLNYQSGRHRFTPLHIASSHGKLTIVATLLEAGAHVDLSSYKGTALSMAIVRGNKEVSALLVEAGADINVSVKYGGTILQEATRRGYKEFIELLIEKGAEINAPGSHRSGTALQEAVKKGDKEIIESLIERGAEINAPSSQYAGTALQEAVKKGDKELIELLIEKGAEINAPANNGSSTALQEAIKREHKEIIESFIEKKAKVNAPANYHSGTALQEAVRRGSESIIAQLIQHGADVNAPENPGSPWDPNPGVAIQEAVKHGDQTIVDMLLLAGADANTPANKNRGTPLQEAVRNDNEYTVKQLIDLGVDVNASAVDSSNHSWRSNCNPEIAIREAVKKGNQKILEMLTRAGAVDPKKS